MTSVWVAAPFCQAPTAKHGKPVKQETPLSSRSTEPAGSGLGSIDQLVPFHRSMSVLAPRVGLLSSQPHRNSADDWPTATQLELLAHDTSFRSVKWSPGGPGLVAIAQLNPFHRSTKVLPTNSPVAELV